MNPQSIFAFIKDNIDEEGCFTAEVLPDDPHPSVPRPLGTEDAYYYTTEVPPDVEGAEQLVKLFRQHIAIPCLESKRRIFDHLTKIVVTGCCDPFLDKFTADELTPEAMELAEEFFYNSTHREPVKFALLIFGLYGMEYIKEKDAELWQDLLDVARCEEFTFFFLFACKVKEFAPQEEIWQLMHCTNNWGKVYAINAASFNTPGKQQWLLENGYDLNVDYPPLSVKMILDTHLAEVLQAEHLNYESYKGASAILNNFLLLINSFSATTIEQNFNTTSIDLENLLQNFLRHAQEYATTPEEMLDIIALALGLNRFVDTQNWYKLSANQCHTLIAACDKILYQKDWHAEIAANLFNEDGSVNTTLCDFAYELDIDIWDKLFAHFCEHPMDVQLFPYLLAFEGGNRSQQVLETVERNIYQYLLDQNSLLIPLRYLRNHPGEGTGIIIAALTSLYDWPRGIACSILDDWGHEYLTPAMRTALHTAQGLSNHPVVNARIEALLAGKKFKFEDVV